MAEFYSLVNLASDAALAIDSKSNVVACNERAAILLGYAEDEILGRPCHDVVQAVLSNGDPLCSPACEGKRCFAFYSPFAVRDCSLRCKDGRRLQAGISTLVAPMLDEDEDEDEAESATVAVIFLQPKGQIPSNAPVYRQLRICTLGRFSLSVADRSVPTHQWHRKQALTLLKLLVTRYGEAVHRDYVLDCLWPDVEEHRARERLKVTTYFLRQRLCAAGIPRDAIIVADATYALRRDAVWLDSEMFESFFNDGRLLEQRGRSNDALQCFEKAERMYKGEYLPGERYADWCAGERGRLSEIYFAVLDHMVEGYMQRGDHENGVQICRLALSREPYREQFHYALMVCFLRLGQCDRAIVQYDRCRRALDAELGVEPAPETKRLFRDAVAGRALTSMDAPLIASCFDDQMY